MALSAEQIGQLIKMIRQTREVELTCPESLEELDKLAQDVVDGLPSDGALALVREHLEACPFCSNEFELVLETLRAIDE